MRANFIFHLLLILGLVIGCKKHKENKIEPDKQFVRYINTSSILTDLVPIDVVRTSDQGFLIMGSSPSITKNYHTIYLLKIDKEGQFVWDGYLPEKYVNPVSDLIFKEGSYNILCMDAVSGTRLIKVFDNGLKTEEIKFFEEIQLPLQGSATPDGGYLILNVNLSDKWSGITKINPDLSTKWSEQYYFNENFAAEIDRHLKREGLPLSFLTGSLKSSEAYYFNGFADANFSSLFLNPADGKTDGYNQIGGDRSYAAIKTIVPLGGNRFAVSRYDRSGNIYFVPNCSIDIKSGTAIANTELGGIKFPDIEPNSRVICKNMLIAGRQVLVYGANSKNKGIGLYLFDSNTGIFLGSKSFSLETPLDMGGFELAQDGGLLVMGKTYIANRFPRVCVFKLNQEEATKLVGL